MSKLGWPLMPTPHIPAPYTCAAFFQRLAAIFIKLNDDTLRYTFPHIFDLGVTKLG